MPMMPAPCKPGAEMKFDTPATTNPIDQLKIVGSRWTASTVR
jgi:hypothetical protein